ncbi:MAG: alpha/beta hydrolase [Chitinophagaceae bacterium]|nr:MAG: alpha/beta hydrolase [Chitinophagaceae bacterium]
MLFILDGGLEFPIANATNGALGLFGTFTKVIIVGIEYEWKKSLTPWFLGRTRDYTPAKDTSFDNSPAYNEGFGLPPGSIVSGGADQFIEVFRKELIPFIEKHYRTNSDRGLSGHSFGGLFTAYSLFRARDLFSRFGINSPSLWWNKRFMFSLEETFSQSNKSLPAKVFMSVGGLEGPMMTPMMTEFAEKLKSRNYQGLELSSFVFEGENHMSVVPAMISRTLRELYEVKKK